MHRWVMPADGEGKYWIEPRVDLVRSWGLSERDLARTRTLVVENDDVIRAAWNHHLGA